jgi:hypothetical protein
LVDREKRNRVFKSARDIAGDISDVDVHSIRADRRKIDVIDRPIAVRVEGRAQPYRIVLPGRAIPVRVRLSGESVDTNKNTLHPGEVIRNIAGDIDRIIG